MAPQPEEDFGHFGAPGDKMGGFGNSNWDNQPSNDDGFGMGDDNDPFVANEGQKVQADQKADPNSKCFIALITF